MSTLTLSIVQTNLHWEDPEANRKMLEQKINLLAGKTEIVLLPEMFSTGFSMRPEVLAETMDGPTIRWMRDLASGLGLILAGSLIIEEGGKWFNRLIWMLPTGSFGFYDKRHLFAFGGEDKKFVAGENRLIASVKGWKINLQVCYDLRFPVWSRQGHPPDEGGPEYDLLLYVANWPERRSLAWKSLLQARAIENQCYVVGVNRVGEDGGHILYSGDSRIIDPSGEILYEKAHDEDLFTCTLDKSELDDWRSAYPFLRDADRFRINT
jgi:omega-amidase